MTVKGNRSDAIVRIQFRGLEAPVSEALLIVRDILLRLDGPSSYTLKDLTMLACTLRRPRFTAGVNT